MSPLFKQRKTKTSKSTGGRTINGCKCATMLNQKYLTNIWLKPVYDKAPLTRTFLVPRLAPSSPDPFRFSGWMRNPLAILVSVLISWQLETTPWRHERARLENLEHLSENVFWYSWDQRNCFTFLLLLSFSTFWVFRNFKPKTSSSSATDKFGFNFFLKQKKRIIYLFILQWVLLFEINDFLLAVTKTKTRNKHEYYRSMEAFWPRVTKLFCFSVWFKEFIAIFYCKSQNSDFNLIILPFHR